MHLKLLRFLMIAFLILNSGCGVTAKIESLLSEELPNPMDSAVSTSPITVNNPLDLSALPNVGTGPYTYEIVQGDGSISGSNYTPGVSAGDVVIKITDAAGADHYIKIPVVATPAVSPAQVLLGTSDVFDFNTVGGVPPFTFSATGGTITNDGVFTADSSTGPATVTVTDSLGNTVTLNVTIQPTLSSSVTAPVIGPTNSVTLSGADGAGGYTYTLVSGPGSVNPTTGVYSPNGSSGTAVIRVTDAAGKTSEQTVTVNAPLEISPPSTILLVYDDKTFEASGGVPPYSYTLSPSSFGYIDLTTGWYTASDMPTTDFVIVTDALGNTATATVQVNNYLSITASKNMFLINSTITAAGTGGFPPYTYSIFSGGGTINPTTGEYTVTTAGTKRLRVTDSTGASTQILLTARNPLSASPINVSQGHSNTITTLGGVTPLTTSVLSGGGSVVNLTYTAPNSTGSATVRVMDAEGNSVDVAVTITPMPQFTQFDVLGPYISSIVNVSTTASNYDQWCILEGFSDTSACSWQPAPLPSVFDTNYVARNGRTYFSFIRRGTAVTNLVRNNFFDSAYPLGSKDNWSEAWGVTANNSGFWVADGAGHKVHKYDANGNWIMSLGKTTSSTVNGQFNYPTIVTTDAANNLYVGEQGGCRVQVFDSNGIWLRKIPADSTSCVVLVGRFRAIHALHVDSAGNLFVGDQSGRIQKFDSSGTRLLTFGTNGMGQGELGIIQGLATDSAGNIFVLDNSDRKVEKFSSSGVWQASFGSYGTSNVNGEFDSFTGIDIDTSDNVRITDQSRLQVFDTAGVFQSTLSFMKNSAPMINVGSSAKDTNGNYYVVHSTEKTVHKYNPSLVFQIEVGSGSMRDGAFLSPSAMQHDLHGNLWVADVNNHRIQKFSPSGAWLKTIGGYGTNDGQFRYPRSLAISQDGSVFVGDSSNFRVQRFDNDGNYVSSFSTPEVTKMAINSLDDLYIATSNATILKVSLSGTTLETYSTSGMGVDAIAVNDSGILYISDFMTRTIKRYSDPSTLLGSFGSFGSGDGQFSFITDIKIKPNGELVITEGANYRVQTVDSTGTYKSKFGVEGFRDGMFKRASGVSIDTSGNIFVADSLLNRVQKFSATGVLLTQ